jgi:hypothetical protein
MKMHDRPIASACKRNAFQRELNRLIATSDLGLEGVAEAVDLPSRPEMGFVARRIGTYEGALVASPGYLAWAVECARRNIWFEAPAASLLREDLLR